MIITIIVALVPAAAFGVYQFGLPAALLLVAGMVTAVATEAVVNKVANQPLSIFDGHAVLVGLMVGMMLPAGAPIWLVVVAAAAGILVGKMPFGPLGSAPLSPALVGILIIAISWPAEVNMFTTPSTAPAELHAADAAPAESPLMAVGIDPSDAADYPALDLFLGKQAGPIGGISPLLLLLGGLFLIWRRVTRWQGAIGYLLGVAVTAGIAHAVDPGGCAPASFHLLTGLTMFGAFFLCTEWTTTPVTPRGLFLFGLIAGVLTIILRMSDLHFGRVPWAITLMTLATPLFDRLAAVPFGKVVRHA
jgi:electron transport complex protein RnfD